MDNPIPKDAETIANEFEEIGGKCYWDLDSCPEFLDDTRKWLRSALRSYAAHLAGVLPDKFDSTKRWSERDKHFRTMTVEEVARDDGHNSAIAACRSAILREAGISE